MKLKYTAIALALAFQATSLTAKAETVSTTDGTLSVIESTAPLGTALSYVRGGDGLTGIAGSYPTGVSSSVAMGSYDHQWLQYGDQYGGDIFMSSGDTYLSQVFAIPGTDHGPDGSHTGAYENLEFIIWGIDSSTGAREEGHIVSIYRDGFDTADTLVGHSDDYTSLWAFEGSYNLFAISSGNHLDQLNDYEGEIDALAAPSAVPLPAALPLMLSGLGVLGFAARRRKNTAV